MVSYKYRIGRANPTTVTYIIIDEFSPALCRINGTTKPAAHPSIHNIRNQHNPDTESHWTLKTTIWSPSHISCAFRGAYVKVTHVDSTAPIKGNKPLPKFKAPHLSTSSFVDSPFASSTSLGFFSTLKSFNSLCFFSNFAFMGHMMSIVHGHIPSGKTADNAYSSALW